MQYLFDETGRRYLDALQQRAARRPLPSARRRRRRASRCACSTRTRATCTSSLAALRRAAHGDAAGAAARLLLRELRQRGERAGAAPRARAHAPARRHRPRRRVSRQHDDAHRHQPVQVQRPRRRTARRRGCTSCRCPTSTAASIRRRRPARRRSTRTPCARSIDDCVHVGAGRRAASSPKAARASAARSSCRPATSPTVYAHVRARRRRVHRRRSADGLRPDRHALLRLRGAGRRPRHRRARQADRQRPPARRRGDDAARSPRRSTTGWSSSARSAATPCRARSGSRCSTWSQEERLQAHAREVGDALLARLRALADRHRARRRRARLGAVPRRRARDAIARRSSRRPRRRPTSSTACASEGILLGTDGPYHNVLKIRPPMPFTIEDADVLASTLASVLRPDGRSEG